VLLIPNSKYLTHGISNLVSLITKTKLGLSEGDENLPKEASWDIVHALLWDIVHEIV
jgi:hypothetical protein